MRTLLFFVAAISLTQFAFGQDEPSAPRSIRVLTIGNSFAGNACKYLKEIARDGNVKLTIGTANLGGCTLERHATLAKQSAADPKVKSYPNSLDSKAGKLSLQEYLRAEPWDYVTLQQMSALSHRAETYHPHIDVLVAQIREHAPKGTILIHQTWAYRPDSPLLKSWGITQDEMQSRLTKAYAGVAKEFNAATLPVGAAFHQVRSTKGREVVAPDPDFDYENPVYPNLPNQKNSLVTGWRWNSRGDQHTIRLDFKHANESGCYLAGLVWYETITGNDAREIQYAPQAVKAADASFLRGVAHDVVSNAAKATE